VKPIETRQEIALVLVEQVQISFGSLSIIDKGAEY